MAVNPRILGEKDLNENIHIEGKFTPLTTDTYDETLILQEVLKKNTNELYACALQSCIVGTGGGNLGKININDKEFDCRELLLKNGVLLGNKLGAKLEPNQLTLRRLCRLFRYQIQGVIRESKGKILSYLYRKYCKEENVDPQFIFPGAEHLVVTKESAESLRKCYQNVDDLLGTKFVIRIDRVYLARGIILVPDK